ncbi:hypothetical protein KCP76_14665 [Salmonella enterica subsp. enterica serovar Weltevreden]|nr:hypothetical protein KCP76_14665 [Salmonella enterica subsp. enterica serovar Weltevreden]
MYTLTYSQNFRHKRQRYISTTPIAPTESTQPQTVITDAVAPFRCRRGARDRLSVNGFATTATMSVMTACTSRSVFRGQQPHAELQRPLAYNNKAIRLAITSALTTYNYQINAGRADNGATRRLVTVIKRAMPTLTSVRTIRRRLYPAG